MKFLSSQEMNKMAKSTLALVIAGTFTFSAATAFASENKEDEEFETVEIKNDPSAEATAESKKDAAESIENDKEELDEEPPSLLPGSYFYFAKLALEKVKLALTFDDIKDAKLLADYASERMAEAEALFAEGKGEEALEAIEKALEQMENAETIVDEEANEDLGKSISDEEDNGNLDESAEVETSDEDDADREDSSDNDTANKETEDEIKEIFAQNIIALQANLAKFSERFDENHPSVLAMQKNIAKFTEKWSEQLIEEKEYTGIDQAGQSSEMAHAPIKSEEAEAAEDPEKEMDESASEEKTVLPENAVKVSKEVKDSAKAEKKKEAKALEAKKRAEAKAAREEAKKAEKEAREAAKQAEKAEREADWKAAKEQQAKKVQEKQAEAKSHAGKGKLKAEEVKGQGKENKGN
ncbi:DUF5667 domain-containing protein [Cytobacillus oceanisediminis]|uniref:DUF5667 domain-containing protein n=1 Tax=Cytobacillus oceanisediminis TaxID=665099 RepID=A0ABX3CJ77_9BACI|nr:DUF5667 domain-containing protein [Cytobacillus oceanisediminis]OHX38886.1 hypothetical protein BBV17_05095 [Cytobacillus oceanisediminis]